MAKDLQRLALIHDRTDILSLLSPQHYVNNKHFHGATGAGVEFILKFQSHRKNQ